MNSQPQARSNIFLIPIGSYFGAEESTYQIVYFPLTGNITISDKNSIADIEAFISGKDNAILDKPILEMLKSMVSEKSVNDYLSKVQKVKDIQKMSVLPNHSCNFSCSYCYSAKGRANIYLDEAKLKAGLDYFIDPARLTERYLTISFIGGGEPLLSWGLVKYGMEYAHTLAQRHGFNLSMTLITNGSIMNENIINHLKIFGVLPDISFDILEDVQNLQRKNYNKVCNTIRMLCNNQLAPSVNATITPSTVHRMMEMLDEMDAKFPEVVNMVVEPVVAPELFSEPADLAAFYDAYLHNFLKARKHAENKGKNVTCRIYKNVDSIIDRGCPSKFALTPQGDISICYCTSSPNETHYEKRVYGNIGGDGSINIDETKFDGIHGINVHYYAKCNDCFAKWHCGGGCMCPNDAYTEPFLDEICVFTRNLVKAVLMERMEEQSMRYDGISLKEQFV